MSKAPKVDNVVSIDHPSSKPIPYDAEVLPPARIRITVDGTTPLMTHNPAGMSRPSGTAKRGTRIPEAEAEAEAGVYRMDDGSCGIKGEAFVGAVAGPKGAAGAWKTKNRGTMKSQLAHITGVEELVPLCLPTGEIIASYIVDQRPVIIGKARILRARPRFDEWSATFTINYDQQLIKEPRLIVDILADAGSRIGVGDYRPRFGRFRVREYQIFD